MDTKVFVRIGDQVVNADNVVSFDIDGSDTVRIRHIGSETPLNGGRGAAEGDLGVHAGDSHVGRSGSGFVITVANWARPRGLRTLRASATITRRSTGTQRR